MVIRAERQCEMVASVSREARQSRPLKGLYQPSEVLMKNVRCILGIDPSKVCTAFAIVTDLGDVATAGYSPQESLRESEETIIDFLRSHQLRISDVVIESTSTHMSDACGFALGAFAKLIGTTPVHRVTPQQWRPVAYHKDILKKGHRPEQATSGARSKAWKAMAVARVAELFPGSYIDHADVAEATLLAHYGHQRIPIAATISPSKARWKKAAR